MIINEQLDWTKRGGIKKISRTIAVIRCCIYMIYVTKKKLIDTRYIYIIYSKA